MVRNNGEHIPTTLRYFCSLVIHYFYTDVPIAILTHDDLLTDSVYDSRIESTFNKDKYRPDLNAEWKLF